MNSDDQRWNITFRWIRDHRVSHHACQSECAGPTPLGLPARRYAVIGNGVDVTSTSVMGPGSGCGLIATMPFMPRDIITAYHGDLVWMPAVTAKASLSSQGHDHSHFKRIAGSDFVISGFKGVNILFGSGGASVANCASRKADANARLVTLWEKKHEDYMWCPSTSRYERVNGTFLVATKDIRVNEEILTWYGKATRARLSLDTLSETVTDLGMDDANTDDANTDDANTDAETPAAFLEGRMVSQVRVQPLDDQPLRPLQEDHSARGTRLQYISKVRITFSTGIRIHLPDQRSQRSRGTTGQ